MESIEAPELREHAGRSGADAGRVSDALVGVAVLLVSRVWEPIVGTLSGTPPGPLRDDEELLGQYG